MQSSCRTKLTQLLSQNKYKYQAWQKLVDEGVSASDAQERYVKLVESLKEKYGYDENKEPEAVKSSS